LDEHNFLGKNTKLAPKYSGPFKIIRIKNNCNAELLLKNGKKLIVHFNRLKPYTFPFYESSSNNVNKTQAQEMKNKPSEDVNKNGPDTLHFDEENVYIPQISQTNTPILFQEKERENFVVEPQTQVKRRGRPPKNVRPATSAPPQITRPPPAPRQPRPPPKNPVEQGGIASRTRSRVQITEEKGVQERGLQAAVNFNQPSVSDEAQQPQVISLLRSKSLLNKAYKSKSLPNKVRKKIEKSKKGNKKRKRVTYTGEIRKILRKYKRLNPPARTLVYYGPLDTSEPDSDSDSNQSLSSDSSTEVETEVEADDNEYLTDRYRTDDEFTDAVSGTDTESEDVFEETQDFPGGAAGRTPVNSPQKSKGPVMDTFDSLIQKADDFLFKKYPKRNIPKKNYKE